MPPFNFPQFEKHLRAFDFPRLFVEVLGWNHPPTERQWQEDQAGKPPFTHRTVAELGGVVAIEVGMPASCSIG